MLCFEITRQVGENKPILLVELIIYSIPNIYLFNSFSNTLDESLFVDNMV